MDPESAAELRAAWAARHRPEEAPSPAAAAAVERLLAERVPEPGAAAAILDAEGRRRVAALAGGALYLVWAVPGAAGTPEAARVRRIPLAPAEVELSERAEEGGDGRVRHWWFEVGEEPIVFRALDADDDAFATALAAAVGWPR